MEPTQPMEPIVPVEQCRGQPIHEGKGGIFRFVAGLHPGVSKVREGQVFEDR